LLFLLLLLSVQLRCPKSSRTKAAFAEPNTSSRKPHSIRQLQNRFLSVFWSIRFSFWLSGPYFYAAFSSKTVNGKLLSMAMVSRISLIGYAAIAIIGPMVGKISNRFGFKAGTVAAAVFYALGDLSIVSNALPVLLMGRVLEGFGNTLMSSAPEAWLISQFKRTGIDPKGKWLQETFGWAYGMDSLIAIGAGQIAGWAEAQSDPTGPFQLSFAFMLIAAVLIMILWTDARAKGVMVGKGRNDETQQDIPENTEGHQSICDALYIIRTNKKVLCLGGAQSLFEAAMYIFILQWPPTMGDVVHKTFGESVEVPYGTIFSCFMACSLAGSSLFGWLARSMKVESLGFLVIAASAVAMIVAAHAINGGHSATNEFWLLTGSYFVFEACVGLYYPSIGTIRSWHLPDTHRSLIMALYGVPLNMLVGIVTLFEHRLGSTGSLMIAASALALSTGFMLGLHPTAA
jgi:MFS family permease